jgi:hypothetical protein
VGSEGIKPWYGWKKGGLICPASWPGLCQPRMLTSDDSRWVSYLHRGTFYFCDSSQGFQVPRVKPSSPHYRAGTGEHMLPGQPLSGLMALYSGRSG